MMKIRIISDLHIDVNSKYPFKLKDKETFTIICGDISGYLDKTSNWLNKNIKRGLLVAGNHIIYNESGHSIQYLKGQYTKNYPLSSSISFLDDSYKIVDDIVFVGGTLWTDYKLLNKDQQDMYMWFATRYLNDFKYGKLNPNGFDENEDINRLGNITPDYCYNSFKKTLSTIENICKKFPDKKIVVITHHAPSIRSVPEIYKNSETAPCFASNLEDFILNNQNIKLWCHGHIHMASNYMIGTCYVVCNPLGYTQYYEKTNFDENLIIEI